MKKIKHIGLIGLISLISLIGTNKSVFASDRFFQVQAIDTMKYSRDEARGNITSQIAPLIEQIALLHPTHVALGTPYNDEFVPFMQLWITQIRKNNIHVWFRGNIAQWEGWFDYPKLTDYNNQPQMVSNFITRHPDLFADGDIFTPAPEAENGAIGDPRQSPQKAQEFNAFLIKSYTSCVQAFATIHKQVTCGYYSTNGDVAKQVLTKDTVKKIGNLVTIDHYVKDSTELVRDIKYLHNKFDAPVMLGEFGAPIPDIHGDMTSDQQAAFIQDNFTALLNLGDVVQGINYWTAVNGTTSIFNESNLTPKKGAEVITEFYNPLVIYGKVLDVSRHPISDVQVTNTYRTSTTNETGDYSLLSLTSDLTVHIEKKGYVAADQTFKTSDIINNQIHIDIVVTAQKPDFWYRMQMFFEGLFNNL